MEETIFLKKSNNIIKRGNLNYLGFHKFFGMYLIIRMHLYDNKNMPFDFGIRMCELLFVSSGFLVGYNYYKKPIEYNYISSIKYAYKHLRLFYPYYLFNLFYGLYLYREKINLDLTCLELLLINILLIANWSSHRKVARFYFGISWFLDNIFYCYFLSNFFLSSINDFKNSLKLFVFATLSRILSEELLNRGAYNVFDTNFHCGPIIRILEFYMGMLIIPLFFKLKIFLDKFKNSVIFQIFFSVIQILSPLLLYYIMVEYQNIFLRCYFVLIICVYIFIISFDFGFLSVLVSLKIFKIIMSTQLEMYLIQFNVHLTLEIYFRINKSGKFYGLFIYYIKLCVIFSVSYLYRRFLRDKLAILKEYLFLSSRK